ncbi:hypothetical protein DMN91_009869 [Ooceraea biroi]|uniref:Odorant receptor n=1 Tax=Ooceraea biroi TaxID=2015173 RepID=A0A3L8DBX6_OOCBI|nr:uncharacterized protein LOC113562725 isoform X1 [Ooceraea biroi]RLU17633.1 hypothetical protein DMN91_009869 [Ooceraea biroi]
MVFAGERCFKLHRIMFMAMGLWPYQNLFIRRIQSVFYFGIYCGNTFFQIAPFLTTTCDMDCTLKRVSYISICLVYLLHYSCFYFNSEAIKQILEHMQLDWKMFKSCDAAMKILEEYLYESYLFAIFVHFLIIVVTFVLGTFESRTFILDIIFPRNVSRQRKLEVDLEFFIDKEQYFILYLIHEVAAVSIGSWAVMTLGTLLGTVGKHCCAAYKIASCLIQTTVTAHTLQFPVAQKMHFMHRNICLSVYIHRRTVEFCKNLLLSFDLWYSLLLLICVLSLSCLMFRLCNALMLFNDFYDILVSAIVLYTYIIYMFVGNFLVQSYTDHSIELVESTYNTLWYVAPLPIKKLFLIMQKSIKSHKLVIGGLFVPSMEGFTTLVTTAISYFSVMYAMHS